MSKAPETCLAFDYGTRRIGVAVGQTLTGTASELASVGARDGVPDWVALEQLIRDWQPNKLVVGIPRYLDGSDSDMTARALRFARQLHGRFGLPVYEQDERLSSQRAEQLLRGKQKGSGEQRKQQVDRVSACIILEDWLATEHE